jgi:membrane-associated phospholipid phosphatase
MWTSAALIPAITGLCRYGAGKHFFTDILVGYAIGSAVGILVPQLHKRKFQ